MSDYYFHGDVVLKKINKLPNDIKRKKDNIIAEGEMTGHAHTVDLKDSILFVDGQGNLYLKNEKPIEIKHQQHKKTFTNLSTGIEEKLPAGSWIIDFPVEYDHFLEESKRVQD